MAWSVGTPSSSSSAVPSIDLFTCLIRALNKTKINKQINKIINCTLLAMSKENNPKYFYIAYIPTIYKFGFPDITAKQKL